MEEVDNTKNNDGAEDVRIHPNEVNRGDYYYVADGVGNNHLVVAVGLKVDMVDLVMAVPGAQYTYYEGLRVAARNVNELISVPISEDWFKSNPMYFTPFKVEEVEQGNVFEAKGKLTWIYLLNAKRWKGSIYCACGLEVNSENNSFKDPLFKECVPFMKLHSSTQKKVTLVALFSFERSSDNFCKEPFAMIHCMSQMQHFMTLCGIPEAFNVVPNSLFDNK